MSIDLIKRAAERLGRERMSSTLELPPEPPRGRAEPQPDAGEDYGWFGREAGGAGWSGGPGLHPRGEIVFDRARLQAAGILGAQPAGPRLVEELRIIKQPIVRTALSATEEAGKSANLVMVTSARPREGKSFLAVNLAISIAMEKSITVLLIDGDFQNPGLSRALRLEDERGLMDFLADPGLTLDDVTRRTDLANLVVLPAGRVRDHATELLASARMATLAERIAELSSCIAIFDTAPLLTSSEPAALAFHVGQSIMVVQAERTNRRSIDEAMAFLRPCPHVGMVLNKAPLYPGGGGLALRERDVPQKATGY
jgi:exopolysaccharide/PEP-CTERM locus tyrosine autokinase